MSFLSANQQYKLSGSSLSFTEWIEREKSKGVVIPQKGITDVYDKEMSEKQEEQSLDKQEPKSSKTILGLNKNMLMLSGLVIVGAIAYKVYTKRK